MRDIYTKYAELLVNYSLQVKKGDKLLVRSTYLAEPLLKKIYEVALKAGAHPEFRIEFNGQQKIFYDYASDKQLSFVPPSAVFVTENYDAFLNIRAPFDVRELEDVDPAKKQTVMAARAQLNKIFRQRWGRGELRWTLCDFPTDSSAQEAQMSAGEFAEFVYSACYLHEDDPAAKWRQVCDEQQRIVDHLGTKEQIRFEGPDIDISFSTKGRKWVSCDGHRNMPDGEVFTSPVEDSVNGRVRFSYPGIYLGQEIEDISLEVKDGEVVSWKAQKGKELLDKIFDIEGVRRFGEAAIGNNYGVNRFVKNMLFDEKMGGHIHMAVGSAPPISGGLNESAIHWDMLADMRDGGKIYADGELIYENGKFLI